MLKLAVSQVVDDGGRRRALASRITTLNLKATGVAPGAVEIRRFGLVAGRTRLDHGEADLSAACWEIHHHG
jgi:hypothetical protein